MKKMHLLGILALATIALATYFQWSHNWEGLLRYNQHGQAIEQRYPHIFPFRPLISGSTSGWGAGYYPEIETLGVWEVHKQRAITLYFILLYANIIIFIPLLGVAMYSIRWAKRQYVTNGRISKPWLLGIGYSILVWIGFGGYADFAFTGKYGFATYIALHPLAWLLKWPVYHFGMQYLFMNFPLGIEFVIYLSMFLSNAILFTVAIRLFEKLKPS